MVAGGRADAERGRGRPRARLAAAAAAPPPAGAAGSRSTGLAARLVQAVAAAVAGASLKPGIPLHEALARSWKRPQCPDAIRRALVLCADHELNPSTFAVRVVASTGAGLIACLLAGLAALSGPRHGGMTARVTALLEEAQRLGDAEAAVAGRLRRGDPIPGFHHPLYPDGDPDQPRLLARLRPHPIAGGVIAAVAELTGQRPTIDVALATLEMSYGLAPGAALALFALGRSVGWIAHAFEQQAAGTLIRPRAGLRAIPNEAD